MMMFQTFKQIAITTTVATASSVLITPTVWAATLYNIGGTFDDGGGISGSFEYDSSTSNYTNINITTTSGSTLSGVSYTDETLVFGASDNGFSIEDNTFTFTLDILFDSPGLAGEPSTVGLNSLTQEENFFDGTSRTITSGSVTAVPENFSPYSGVLVLALLGMRAAAVKSKKEQARLNG